MYTLPPAYSSDIYCVRFRRGTLYPLMDNPVDWTQKSIPVSYNKKDPDAGKMRCQSV